MEKKHHNLSGQFYGLVCGQGLEANFLHFQFLPAYYARRDIIRDGAKLRGRLLDLGCGNQPYRQYLTGVTQYIGLDYPSTQACLNIRVKPEVHGDARTLPFVDQSFDGVLCCQVLEHVNRPDAVVRELSRILRPGGVGIISIPFFYNLHLEPNDYFRFSPYGIKNLLEQNGLSVCQIRGQGSIGTLLVQMFHNWLFSALGRRARRHAALGAILTLVLPLLLLLSALNNLAALALDYLNHSDLRFSPNLWVMVKKASS